jgi:dCTP diphosphatase
MNEFERLTDEIRKFAQARNWEQFHTSKNLAMAIAGEAGELNAEFQWLSPPDKLKSIALEIADVQIYLLRLADVLAINIPEFVREKLATNESRFPV